MFAPFLFTLLVPFSVSECVASNDKNVEGGQYKSANEQALIEEVKGLENDRLAAGVRKDIEAVSAATTEDYIQMVAGK